MDKVANLSSQKRTELFRESAAKKGVKSAIIEKDFWLCWVLQKIFSEPSLKNKLLFKGGTSLSKVFNVIERFSEDVDLILNWSLVCGEDPLSKRSKTRQGKLNQEIDNAARQYIGSNLLPLFSKLYSPLCEVTQDLEKPHCLKVKYPRSFEDRYIKPDIVLEIGPLASWLPHDTYKISSYAAEYFPEVFNNIQVDVCAIEARRTFWEKATILHHEAHRPDAGTQPPRYSRHYYDLAMLAKTDIKSVALGDLALLDDVAAFKSKFYSRGWAHYELAKPGTFRLIPPTDMIKILERDYIAMQEMIFGEKISFNIIFENLQKLEDEINALKGQNQ